MKTKLLPAAILGVLCVVFLVLLATTMGNLPPRMATHFSLNGQPDAWMSRLGYTIFMLGMGLLLPLLVAGFFYALRFLPESTINLPNRDYWLSGERRKETFRYVARHGLWISCATVALLMALHWLIVDANARSTPQLRNSLALAVAGLYVLAVAGWVAVLFSRFRAKRVRHDTSPREGTRPTR